jgi:Uma2 family endonuclease
MNPAVTLWQSIIENPFFRDVPYKVETTRAGAILMSPASNWHGSAQSQIAFSLRSGRTGGEIITECSILTAEGVKVADVAWASDGFMNTHGYSTPYPIAPEICVEIVSPGNSTYEIETKVNLYLAKGATEVWVVDQEGAVTFFDHSGARTASGLVDDVKVNKRRTT